MNMQANFADGDHLIDHRDGRRMRDFVQAVSTDLQTAESLLHGHSIDWSGSRSWMPARSG
jgi:hypothetical protein